MRQLWSPWRMAYLRRESQNPSRCSCIFCDKPAENRDAENMIVHRGEAAYVILNIYPYNNGHLMIVPYRHVPSLEQLDTPVLTELMLLANQSLAALRAAYQPQAFNLGLNIGAAAGAGIVAHVHLHVVPRWAGDTNFISTISETRVIPEDLAETYQRLRAVWPAPSASEGGRPAPAQEFSIRPLTAGDGDWVAQFVAERWGADFVVARGEKYVCRGLPGFVATAGEERLGLITYQMTGEVCEVITLDSLRPGCGVGTALLTAVVTAARQAGCRCVRLITTNDNLNALRFYQRRGFRLKAVYRDALAETRQYKPLPPAGQAGIPLQDEIELELILGQDKPAAEDARS